VRARRWPPNRTGTWVLDLDGVIWLTGEPIAGAPGAVAALRGAGVRTLFATNNSAPTTAELLDRLARAGIAASKDDLVTSAHAAAGLLEPGTTVSVLAEGGVLEALAERGVRVVAEGPVDAVVVGWTHDFDFERLAAAATAVREGARLIGTNEDATHPTPHGLLPGSGALLAAVATASGVDPEVAGKPHEPMAALITQRVSDAVVVVGDRPSTDGLLARRLDVAFALVLSGVTSPGGAPPEPPPDVSAPDLAGLVAEFFSTGPDAPPRALATS